MKDLSEYIARCIFEAGDSDGLGKTDRIAELYKRGARNNMPAIRGTWWSLFNAVTEFIDHESKFRGENAADNRFESLIAGPLAETKSAALRLALQMA